MEQGKICHITQPVAFKFSKTEMKIDLSRIIKCCSQFEQKVKDVFYLKLKVIFRNLA